MQSKVAKKWYQPKKVDLGLYINFGESFLFNPLLQHLPNLTFKRSRLLPFFGENGERRKKELHVWYHFLATFDCMEEFLKKVF